MNYLKKYSKSLLISFIILFILSLFITLLSYFNILNYAITKYMLKGSIFISLFIGSFIFGIGIKKKYALEGFKFSIIYILLFLILNGINLKSIIYYLSFIVCSIIGTSLSINIKKGD